MTQYYDAPFVKEASVICRWKCLHRMWVTNPLRERVTFKLLKPLNVCQSCFLARQLWNSSTLKTNGSQWCRARLTIKSQWKACDGSSIFAFFFFFFCLSWDWRYNWFFRPVWHTVHFLFSVFFFILFCFVLLFCFFVLTFGGFFIFVLFFVVSFG